MATRSKIIKIAKTYLNAEKGSKKHKKLVDTFNKKKPHGEVAKVSYDWCAMAATAWSLLAGLTDKQMAMSFNCGTLINDAKKLKIWVENDNYLPSAGDFIIYDWSDNGIGENKDGADHVGLVVKVSGSTIKVIEGNYSTLDKVAYRTIKRNQQYIRGYIVPKYEQEVETSVETKTGNTYKVITPEGLNIRSTASTKGEIKGVIPVGKKVKCLAEDGNWIKVTYKYNYKKKDGKKTSKSTTGWICLKQSGEVFAEVVA